MHDMEKAHAWPLQEGSYGGIKLAVTGRYCGAAGYSGLGLKPTISPLDSVNGSEGAGGESI